MPAPFPDSATRDSLFGNTETFGGLANVTPAFRITGLRTGIPHTLAFYASRTGVSDNRETRYTVTGQSTASVDLDAANNIATVATLGGIEPDPDGVVAVALSPGPRNNNANHFTYLGALQLEWRESGPVPAPTLSVVRATPGNLRVRLGAGFGRACRIERSSDLITWTPLELVWPPEGGLDIDIDIDMGDPSGAGFLRAVDVP